MNGVNMDWKPADLTAWFESIPAEIKTRLEPLDALEAIHRTPEDYICFFHKPDGKGQAVPWGAIRRDQLRQQWEQLWLPGLGEAADLYHMVNSAWEPGKGTVAKTGLPYPLITKGRVQHLNACYADLDVGRPKDPDPRKRITVGQAMGEIIDMQDRGEIPPVTMFLRSGQGLWCLWFLFDQDGQPQRAWPYETRCYVNIQNAIVERLWHLGADITGKNINRLMPVPGTRKTGRAEPLDAWFQVSQGRLWGYSLDGLARALSVNSQARHEVGAGMLPHIARSDNPYGLKKPLYRPGSAPGRKGNVAKGYRAWVQEICLIERMREGFRKNTQGPQGSKGREMCLMYLAEFMRRGKYPEAETLEMVERLARNCRPPYPSDEGKDMTVKELVGKAYRKHTQIPYKLDRSIVARMYGVTDDEAREWGLARIVSQQIQREINGKPSLTRIATQQRRLKISKLIREHGYVSQHKMVNLLRKEGISTTQRTVGRDYEHFTKAGVLTDRQPGTSGRPNKRTDQHTGDLFET